MREAAAILFVIIRSPLPRILDRTMVRSPEFDNNYQTTYCALANIDTLGGLTMRHLKSMVWTAAITLTVAAVPAAAHHSFAAEYDSTKPVELTGTVTKVEWQNPHTFFYIDVKDEKTGQVSNWSVELGSPNSLMRLGWTQKSMKLQEVVKVQGSLAKDGSKLVNARNVVLASTGQRLLTGSSEGTTP